MNGLTGTGVRVRLPVKKLINSTCECHNHDYPPWTGEIHGMSQALQSKSLTLRVFWWIVLVLCTSCGTATTILVIIEYIRGPTATSTTIRLVPTMELPAITVCPKVPDAFNFEEMYRDMKLTLPHISKPTASNLVRFWLGGSGLENMDELPEFNSTYLEQLSKMYDAWSAGYEAQSFFDLMHAKYGFKCSDLFHMCDLGGKPKDCCKTLFHRRPVMRRGFCYQTRRDVNQTEADDIGRLVLSLKAPPSVTSPQYNFIQPQIIIYINDNHEQVLDFPRFYLYPHEWNRMHFTARLVELLEHPSDCTTNLIGKDANCFVRNWLTVNVIDPYNCTVPYLTDIDGVPKYPTCKPQVLAKEYYNAIQLVHSGSVHSHECIPGCTRWEYTVSLQQSPSLAPFTGHVFNLEASFYDLQYEHVKEVFTTSVPGFMSQIGGQFGFFLGLSIITMIQIIIYFLTSLAKIIYRFAHRTYFQIFDRFTSYNPTSTPRPSVLRATPTFHDTNSRPAQTPPPPTPMVANTPSGWSQAGSNISAWNAHHSPCSSPSGRDNAGSHAPLPGKNASAFEFGRIGW
ncbi:amiloride-sensitive sodium channel domain-containing protein [Ditylenchus destructor]|uniref:Amiloride-sensitive sodium channel domain-containing protein n=1 Tax=Ditylenchus destructor TaxID=166010 RepID=A0AAD4NEX4_9BILA|nr:amiloride-sensitive sodium channel domain-containing protein [Ditylenchus destructor]